MQTYPFVKRLVPVFALGLGLAGCVIDSSDDDDGGDSAADTSAGDGGTDPTGDGGTDPTDDGGTDPTDATTDGGTAPADDSSGGDDGPLAACAGTYSGTFTGDDAGVATADLQADGTITLTFTTSVGPVSAEGTVSETGEVFGMQDGTTVEGMLDLTDCSMSGTWVTTGFGEGEWMASLD